MVNRLLFTLLLILFLVIAGGSTALSAFEPLMASLEPSPVGVRDNTTLTVDLPLSSIAGLDTEIPDLPQGLSLWRGPFYRIYQGMDYQDQGYDQFVRVTITFRSSTAGRMIIPPFDFSAGGVTWRTKALLLEVGQYQAGVLRIPFLPEWKLEREQIYAGETIPLVLQIPMQRELLLVDEVKVDAPREGFLERTETVGAIEQFKLSGFTFYNLPAAGFLFTPERSGTLTIPAAQIVVDGVTEQAAGRTLTVRALPGQLRDTGAVGDFSYRSEVSDSPVFAGETFPVTIKITGKGNLPYLTVPEPLVTGAELVDSRDKSDLFPTSESFSGSRIVRFEYLVTGDDDIEIIYPPFPFLVPGTGRIVYRNIPKLTISPLLEDQQTAYEESKPFPFEPVLLSTRTVSFGQPAYTQSGSYLWLLPGPMLFSVFLFFGRKARARASLSLLLILLLSAAAPGSDLSGLMDTQARAAYDAGDDETAFHEYKNLLAEYPEHGTLLYNCAVTAYRAGRIGEAVYYARIAFRVNPTNSKIAELVSYIEEREAFGFQAPLPAAVHPDVFFFLLMVCINGAGFLGVFFLLHRRNLTFIAAVLLCTISLASAVGLAFSAHDWNRVVVVAAENTPVWAIPDPESASLFTLREGESVNLLGSSGNKLFIRTGIETGGWVSYDAVFILGSRGE